MKKNIRQHNWVLTSLIIPSLLVGLGLNAHAKDAKLFRTKGVVEIRTASNSPWVKAERGQNLLPGTEIRTKGGSTAHIRTSNRHQLRLSSDTIIKLENLKQDKTIIKVFIGRMRSIVRKLRAKAQFKVKTPLAVASVRGTKFDTIVESDDKSGFEVLKGVVGVNDLQGIGQEVRVLGGQSTTVLRGKAPSAPAEFRQRNRRTDSKTLKFRQMVRLEARREIAYQRFKEFLQKDVAHEQRIAEYQDGKTIIDAFGMRVRIEEYIVRPNPRQFSFVTINTRENTVAFSRYDAFSKHELPPKLNDINSLFSRSGDGTGTDKPSNYIIQQKWFVSNGADLYREWTEGGDMVWFADRALWKVVWLDWYVEIKGGNEENFLLLSHWRPHPQFRTGTKSVPDGTENVLIDGVRDIPVGYKLFDQDNSGQIGDVRPIDTATFEARLPDSAIFNNPKYQNSEGYTRSSHAEFDGVPFSILPNTDAQISAILNAKKVTAFHNYTGPQGQAITTLQSDQYTVDDLGTKLSLADRRTLGLTLNSVNFEYVLTSPLFGSKIDLVLTPRIFQNAGLVSE